MWQPMVAGRQPSRAEIQAMLREAAATEPDPWVRTEYFRMGEIDPDHLVCCDEDTALCGEDLTGGSWSDDDSAVLCPVCEEHNYTRQTCGARFCRLRQVARQIKGRNRS